MRISDWSSDVCSSDLRSVTLLHGQKLSELIAMNGPVKAALEMWLTQWRPQLMNAWVNYQYMRYEMWPAYEKADLPEAVLFGIMAKESGEIGSASGRERVCQYV